MMLWSRLRRRLFEPPADLYLRVDEVVQAPQSIQRNTEKCEQRNCGRRNRAFVFESDAATLQRQLRAGVVSQPDAAQRRGDWAEAARLYELAAAQSPTRTDLLIQLGRANMFYSERRRPRSSVGQRSSASTVVASTGQPAAMGPGR